MKEEKKALRKLIAQRKAQYSLAQCEALSAVLIEQLERHPRFVESHIVLLYYSLPDEVYTHELVKRWYQEKTILLPVVKEDELELRYYTGEEDLRIGSYGIKEPIGRLFTDYRKIELAVVPGVSFDKDGNRLGRGKGYYDRLLPKLSSYNIGICYAFQMSDNIPCETFDRKMDAILTDEGWIRNEDKISGR